MKFLILIIAINLFWIMACKNSNLDEDLKNAASSNRKVLYYEYSKDEHSYTVSRGALVLLDIDNNKKIYLSADAPTSLEPTFSPDGSKIVLKDFGKLEIWDLLNAIVKKIKISDSEITSLAFLNNETLLYSQFNRVFKYSLLDGKSELLFESDTIILKIHLSPTTKYLAARIVKNNPHDLTSDINIYYLPENKFVEKITAARFIGWIDNNRIMIRKYLGESKNLHFQIVDIQDAKINDIGEKINDSLTVSTAKYILGKNFMVFRVDQPHTEYSGTHYYPENIGLYEYNFADGSLDLIFKIDKTKEICDYSFKQ